MTARVLFPFDMSGFFFSFLLSESSETFRMFPMRLHKSFPGLLQRSWQIFSAWRQLPNEAAIICRVNARVRLFTITPRAAHRQYMRVSTVCLSQQCLSNSGKGLDSIRGLRTYSV